MAVIGAFTILVLFLGIGDVIAQKTKAYINSYFVFAVLLLLGFWVFKLPEDIIATSGATAIGTIACAFCMIHLATTIPLREFFKQWKTIIIGVCAVVFIAIFCGGIGSFLLGRTMALSGAPIVAGGISAQLVLSEPLATLGLERENIFTLLILVLQMIIGTPICSIIMKRDARQCLSSGRISQYKYQSDDSGGGRGKKLIPALPEAYQKPTVLLAKTGVVALIAYWVSGLTGINGLMLSMIFGIIFSAIGFLESNIMEKAGAMGILMAYVVFFCFTSTYNATPQMVASLLIPLIVIFALGLIGIVVSGFIMHLIFKESFGMCVAIGLVALIGFPGIWYISKEVSSSVGTCKEEVQALENYTMPRLVVANFATMTVPSVILASIVVPMLVSAA